MANRNWNNAQALDKEVKFLFGEVTFGASGAVASQTSLGFTVTKPTGTGLYRITLADSYPECLGVFLTGVAIGGALGDIWEQQTAMASSVIDIQSLDNTGAAANATSGNKLNIMLVMKNTAIGP